MLHKLRADGLLFLWKFIKNANVEKTSWMMKMKWRRTDEIRQNELYNMSRRMNTRVTQVNYSNILTVQQTVKLRK